MPRGFGRKARGIQAEPVHPATRPISTIADPAAQAVSQQVEDAALAPVTAPAEVVLANRYRLGRSIGQGGMATVHAAQDLLLHRDVAVKLFRSRVTSTADLHLQEAEARVVASLNHYALTTLFDAGVEARDGEDPQIYLVMEHVEGVDLRTRLRQGPLETEQVCWLGFDLAEGLDYVHLSGLLHRDIKPANVLLSDRRSERRLRGKLADFGIAAVIGQPDHSEFTTGTAAYLSPEVVEGRDAVPASDTYSLGLVLLEALTGKVEYPGGIEESAFARLHRDPVIPASLPAAVARVVGRMTARRPQDRISLADAALGFQEFLVDRYVQARAIDPALIDAREAERVAALHRYDILDTPGDAAFDAITRLASRVLDAPIALVTLVDIDRVWFKSALGWDEQQVDRDVAFCSTTNPGTGLSWTIPDALADPRTRINPLVTGGPAVRSYAGAPLVTRDGHNLGALCVFDRNARAYTQKQMDSLADLAELVMHEMEIRSAARRALFSRS